MSVLSLAGLSGCSLLLEDQPQAGKTPSPTITPTPSLESGYTFTPEPEPEIFTNKTRGETVARIQRRLKDLGYFNYRPTGYYLTTTVESMIDFQNTNGLGADGSVGEATIDKLFYKNNVVRKNTGSIPDAEPPEPKEPTQFGEQKQWESVAQLIPVGDEFSVDDLNSDHTLKLKRTGGEHHIHAEPLTQADGEQLKAMFSKITSGEKRPVLVKYEGATIAASMYGAAHGADSVSDNGLDGYICIYVKGCKDDSGYGMADVEHNSNIDAAAGLNEKKD